jgi:hypothetical protein
VVPTRNFSLLRADTTTCGESKSVQRGQLKKLGFSAIAPQFCESRLWHDLVAAMELAAKKHRITILKLTKPEAIRLTLARRTRKRLYLARPSTLEAHSVELHT